MTLLKSWLRVFLHPLTPVFRDELKHKNNFITFLGIAAAALIGLGLSWLIHLVSGQPAGEFKGLASVWVDPGTQAPFGSWSLIIPLGVVVGFYDFQIVLFIFSWLLGGRGSFGSQAYVQSLFYAPLVIVQQVFTEIPYVGIVLFSLMAVYSLVPTTTSLKAAHGYSTIKAVLTWILPIILNITVVYIIVMILTAKST